MHLDFAVELYNLQADSGRLFLHEHPKDASSWDLKSVRALASRPGVISVIADQCMLGLTTWDADSGEMVPAKKATRFLTNCPEIAAKLDIRCDKGHTHQPLVANRARRAQTYPPALCHAICSGLVEHIVRQQIYIYWRQNKKL